MARVSGRRDDQLRLQLTREAARWLAQHHSRDFLQAKRRAGERLGIQSRRLWPSNEELEMALMEYQQLFHGDSREQTLQHLRQTAIEAMRLLERFRPRLVGAVLSGSADEHAAVQLHIFADTAEEPAMFLSERGLPYDSRERKVRSDASTTEFYPLYSFMAGDTPVELTVFPERKLAHPPLSPIDGKPMRRADRTSVEALLN